MSYLPDHKQGRLRKANRLKKQEREKKKGKMAGVSGGGNRTLARIISEKAERITKKNARFSK